MNNFITKQNYKFYISDMFLKNVIEDNIILSKIFMFIPIEDNYKTDPINIKTENIDHLLKNFNGTYDSYHNLKNDLVNIILKYLKPYIKEIKINNNLNDRLFELKKTNEHKFVNLIENNKNPLNLFDCNYFSDIFFNYKDNSKPVFFLKFKEYNDSFYLDFIEIDSFEKNYFLGKIIISNIDENELLREKKEEFLKTVLGIDSIDSIDNAELKKEFFPNNIRLGKKQYSLIISDDIKIFPLFDYVEKNIKIDDFLEELNTFLPNNRYLEFDGGRLLCIKYKDLDNDNTSKGLIVIDLNNVKKDILILNKFGEIILRPQFIIYNGSNDLEVYTWLSEISDICIKPVGVTEEGMLINDQLVKPNTKIIKDLNNQGFIFENVK